MYFLCIHVLHNHTIFDVSLSLKLHISFQQPCPFPFVLFTVLQIAFDFGKKYLPRHVGTRFKIFVYFPCVHFPPFMKPNPIRIPYSWRWNKSGSVHAPVPVHNVNFEPILRILTPYLQCWSVFISRYKNRNYQKVLIILIR